MRLNPWWIAGGAGALIVTLLLVSRRAAAATVTKGVEGMSMTEAQRIQKIVKAAEAHLIPPAVALAIADVESGGSSGFSKKGRMIIRFEPHHFKASPDFEKVIPMPPQFYKADGKIKRGGQDQEWALLEAAMAIDRVAALRAISMGMFQIMGFNHKTVGYPTVEAMFQAYSTDAEAQLRGFFDFCAKTYGNEHKDGPTMRLDKAARIGNFLIFARGYNGKGQKGYDVKMKNRYDYWVKKGYAGIGSTGGALV